jgi:hypothetical protein
MSWQLRDQHLDKALGQHYVTLHEPSTGAEHHLIILTGHDACPTCGHVTPKANTGELDFKALLKNELSALEQSHAQSEAYARKHSIPVLRADGSKR